MYRALAVVVATLVFTCTAGCEPAKIELPDPGKNAVTITITTDPPGSTVSVDGVPVGLGPQTVKLRPGPHRLKALKSGYFAAEQRVVASSGYPKTIGLTLVASH